MQSNVQIPPSMAELGSAIIVAVKAILDNPAAASAAEKAKLEASAMTAKELGRLEADRKLMADAEAERAYLAEWKAQLDKHDASLAASQDSLARREAEHTANVDEFNQQVQWLNKQLAEVAEREKEAAHGKAVNETEAARLAALHEELLDLSAELERRETVLKEFNEKFSGHAA